MNVGEGRGGVQTPEVRYVSGVGRGSFGPSDAVGGEEAGVPGVACASQRRRGGKRAPAERGRKGNIGQGRASQGLWPVVERQGRARGGGRRLYVPILIRRTMEEGSSAWDAAIRRGRNDYHVDVRVEAVVDG